MRDLKVQKKNRFNSQKDFVVQMNNRMKEFKIQMDNMKDCKIQMVWKWKKGAGV